MVKSIENSLCFSNENTEIRVDLIIERFYNISRYKQDSLPLGAKIPATVKDRLLIGRLSFDLQIEKYQKDNFNYFEDIMNNYKVREVVLTNDFTQAAYLKTLTKYQKLLKLLQGKKSGFKQQKFAFVAYKYSGFKQYTIRRVAASQYICSMKRNKKNIFFSSLLYRQKCGSSSLGLSMHSEMVSALRFIFATNLPESLEGIKLPLLIKINQY